MVGAIFFSSAKDECLRKGQWSFRTYGESSWKDVKPITEPGLNVWMKFFGITRRRTHFSSLYSDFLVLLRIGAVPHLWSRQTSSLLINLKLRVRFFPKIPDQIKNPNPKESRTWHGRSWVRIPSGAQIFFCVLLWLILYISLYFLYNMNPKEFSLRKETMYPNPERIIFHSFS